jgi:hypothetical protein
MKRAKFQDHLYGEEEFALKRERLKANRLEILVKAGVHLHNALLELVRTSRPPVLFVYLLD